MEHITNVGTGKIFPLRSKFSRATGVIFTKHWHQVPRIKMNEKNPPKNFTGLWLYKCPTGITYETEYSQGIEHGAYRHKLPSGVSLREGEKCNGLDHGLVTVRSSSGAVIDNYQFVHGNGTHRIYTSSGAMGWEIPYKDGKPHGIKRHYKNGKVVSEQEYCNGQKI